MESKLINRWNEERWRQGMALSARWSSIIAFAIVLALLVLYVLHYGRSDFSSDDAVLSLQAESMWLQGTLFPEGWVGNNGDLMMPSGVLLVAPLLRWFPNNFELHAVVGIFAIVLMLASFAAYLRVARVPFPILLLATAVVASGLSRISAIMLYLQTTYVWWPVAFLLGATLICGYRQVPSSRNRSSVYPIAGMALLVFLVTLSNPGRAALMVVFPLYVFDRVLCGRSAVSRKTGMKHFAGMFGIADPMTLVGIGVGFAAATLAYVYLFSSGLVQTQHNSSALRWEGWAALLGHARIFVFGWFDYLGGVREMNAPDTRLENLLQPLRLGFVVWLSWVGLSETIRLPGSRDPLRSALTGAFLASFVPILFLYVSFTPLAINFTTTRYFTVPIVILVALAAVRVSDRFSSGRWIAHAVSIGFGAILVVACLVRFVPAMSNPAAKWLDLRESQSVRLAEVVVKEGLHWGYATWWNAGVITVLTGGNTRINPVQFNGLSIMPFPYLSQQKYFRPDQYAGPTFLLLSPGEASAERLSTIKRELGDPSRVITTPDAIILTFNGNIAASFSCIDLVPMDEQLRSSDSPGRIIAFRAVSTSSREQAVRVSVEMENLSDKVLSGVGAYPMSIVLSLLDESGRSIDRDWLHFLLPCAVQPGEHAQFGITLPAIPAGRWKLQANLVQEGVAWFPNAGVGLEALDLVSASEQSPESKGLEAH